MYRNMFKIGLVAAFLFLAACSSTKEESEGSNLDVTTKKAPTTDNSASNGGGDTTVVDTSGSTIAGGAIALDPNDPYGLGYSDDYLRSLGIDRNPLEYDTIYFPYNSSSFGERGKIIIEAHAKNLASLATLNVVLEGHADERGTREYNLALGERRGQAVQDMMNALGTGTSGLQVISYGEERPVVLESNEDAWRANRRVQILY